MTDAPISRRQLLAGGAGVVAATGAAALAQTGGSATPSLSGKAILVTGCSSGFGRVGAELYARAGARVIASMRNMPRPEAEALRRLARDAKLDLHVVELDVLDQDSVERAVAQAEKIAGHGLDVLVNNAGIGISGPVELQDAAAAEAMFGTNVLGYLRVARAALPGMRGRPGALMVNISSQLGRVIIPNIGLYSATKFAVEAVSEQLAYELAPKGVEVSIIQPGGYPTEIWENGDRYTAALLERLPQERKAAYPELVDSALRGGGAGGPTDPADVPRAIAELIAMPTGQRPLRRPVHPGAKPQEPINTVSAEVQGRMLGRTPYSAWAKDVLG